MTHCQDEVRNQSRSWMKVEVVKWCFGVSISPPPPSPSLPSPHSPFPSPPPPVGCGKVHSQAAGSHESLTYDFLAPMNKDLRLQIPNVTWLFNVLCSVNLFLNLLFT